MGFLGDGDLAMGLTHLAKGMVKQVALPDLRPIMMITWSTVLWALVTIVIGTDLLSVNFTISIVC